MTDQGPSGGSNAHEFTVSELSGTLKRAVEDQFGHVRVRGELSGVKRAASGHLYLALKDDNAVLDGVCWRGQVQRLSFRPEDGLEVICSGRLTTYPGRSKYQIVIDRMEPAGAGALMALLEERKKKLAAEGLFSPDRKKSIPFLPRVIGVVTSPTGSVIRDILHRLNDRFARHVLVWPVLVQGDGAADQIAAAIRGFNSFAPDGALPRPDVLIVARGGGSIEDLWSFNEEAVVRAAAESSIPLISAVGHETDTTLIDYAADRRAPTPTGAAEMAVPVRADLLAMVADLVRRLDARGARLVSDRRDQVNALARALPTPRDLLGLKSQKLDDLSDRLPRSLQALVAEKKSALLGASGGVRLAVLKDRLTVAAERLSTRSARLRPAALRRVDQLSSGFSASARMLESLSYTRVLERGFVLVEDENGQMVTRGADLVAGTSVSLQFHDSRRRALVEDGKGGPGGRAGSRPKSGSSAGQRTRRTATSETRSDTAPDKQGSLF